MSGPAPRRRGISSWAIARPVGTIMLTSTLLVLGLVYIGRIPVDLLPRIVYPQVRVSVSNAGVEPIVLEETIAKPLESSLATVQNVERLQTEISEGRVSVSLDFRYGTNVDVALQDVATSVERVRSRLPEESDPPTIFKSDPSQQQIYQVAFSSDTRDLVSLRQWLEQRLRPQLLSVSGVASVDVSGGLVREVQVELDPERLRGFGLGVNDVLSGLRNDNLNVAGGRVLGTDYEQVSRTTGKFSSLEDIRGTILSGSGGARIPLRDVATVRDTNQPQRFWARLDGRQAIRIGLQKQPEANTVDVVDNVKAKLDQLRESGYVPEDIRYETTFDQSGFIRDALSSVRGAALSGAVLAMFVVLLFLRSFRKTFVIGLSIPLAIVATFIMMGMGGLTLNIMSLGGLALGTGLLLDNAIVMLENIYRKREVDGLDAEESAHEGAAEVTSAIVAATTTNLVSVAPFLLIVGLAALIFRELILTISFAILASLPLALTLVPMLAAQLGKIRFKSGLDRFAPFVWFDGFIRGLTNVYRGAARRVISVRWLVVGGAVAATVGALYVARDIPTQFLPPVDDGAVGAYVRLPPGATPEQTNRVVQEVEALAQEMPHVESVFATAGGFLWGGSSSANAGRGSLDILLASPSERNITAEQWVQQLQQKIDARGLAGARVYVRPPRIRGLRTGGGSDASVSVAVVGDELLTLEAIGRDIARNLEGVPGLENFQVSTDEPSPLLSISLDRVRARALGLDVATVGQTVRTALDGTVATRYAEGNFEYDVRVFFPRGRYGSVADLADLPLFPPVGGSAPITLRDVARVGPALGPSDIRRVNQNRQIQLTGDVISEVATVGAVSDSIKARLANYQVPEGYGLIVGGEADEIEESNRQLTLVVGLAVFLVFVVLAVQYESIADPLVIMAAVPMSLVGVVGILKATGTPFSAPAFLGMILLAGIVVNNAILLVEFIEAEKAAGHDTVNAVVEAGAARLRPILMTTITSLVGTAPLALGLGEGSELMRPLAIAVVGGLSVSTLLTLFVVPCLYLLVDAARGWLQASVTGKPTAGSLGEPVPAAGD